jgi:hypothetical protein
MSRSILLGNTFHSSGVMKRSPLTVKLLIWLLPMVDNKGRVYIPEKVMRVGMRYKSGGGKKLPTAKQITRACNNLQETGIAKIIRREKHLVIILQNHEDYLLPQ